MKKELLKRAMEYAASTKFPEAVRFTTTVPDARYKGYKYFFLYLNTGSVSEAFKNQDSLDEFLESKGFPEKKYIIPDQAGEIQYRWTKSELEDRGIKFDPEKLDSFCLDTLPTGKEVLTAEYKSGKKKVYQRNYGASYFSGITFI